MWQYWISHGRAKHSVIGPLAIPGGQIKCPDFILFTICDLIYLRILLEYILLQKAPKTREQADLKSEVWEQIRWNLIICDFRISLKVCLALENVEYKLSAKFLIITYDKTRHSSTVFCN